MARHALVTGSKGFIGQRLCRILGDNGYAVHTLNRRGPSEPPHSYAIDLSRNDWPFNPCEGVDVVFHLAGKAHALAETEQRIEEYQRINTEGTRRLLDAAAAAGVQGFVFFSSVKATGDCITQPMDESNTAAASTPYGQSKHAAEELVLGGGQVPHSVVIRPCMVYGNTTKGNLPRLIKAVRQGIFPSLPEVNNKRSMVHVDDVAQAALIAAESPQASGQVYIVSDSRPYSTREIYEWICDGLGKTPSAYILPPGLLKAAAYVGDRIGQLRGRRFLFDSEALEKLIGSAWYSSAKIEQQLGFAASRDLKGSLPEIVNHLCAGTGTSIRQPKSLP